MFQALAFYIDLLLFIMLALAIFLIWFFYTNVKNAKKLQVNELKACKSCNTLVKTEVSICPNCGNPIS